MFNVVVSISSYAIPFCGFLYWYVSVPYFLWKRKEETTAIKHKFVISSLTVVLNLNPSF